MPHFIESSSMDSSDAESSPKFVPDVQRIVSDAEYAAASLPDYSEAPISEQLEPIAVVGMGKSFVSAPLNGVTLLRVVCFTHSHGSAKG